MLHLIRTGLTTLGTWTAHPAAFGVAVAYTAAWIAADPHGFRWHEVAVAATLFMALLIQRAEHRDTQAIPAKLDELLRSHGEARTDLARLDEAEPEEIEGHRGRVRDAMDS